MVHTISFFLWFIINLTTYTNISEIIRNSKIRKRELEEIQILNSKSEETKSIKNAFHIKDPKERT